jgi:NAD(P)-dependent dehydrogenase (short-subunit alcohol dehydrogenase family)
VELGLRGRRALITGASRGIGRAVAGELAAEGVDLALCARGREALDVAARELRMAGVRVFARPLDVTDPHAVEAFVGEAAAALGGIDIVVNNAGRAQPGTFATLTDGAWRADLDVKLMSQIRVTRAALGSLRASGRGRVININAVAGRQVQPGLMATTTNRAACLAFTKSLAHELAPEGILVNSVNIGLVLTPQWENIRAHLAPDTDLGTFTSEMARRSVPLARFGAPEEVSGIIAFLCSDRASYITGASIDVSGGLGSYL